MTQVTVIFYWLYFLENIFISLHMIATDTQIAHYSNRFPIFILHHPTPRYLGTTKMYRDFFNFHVLCFILINWRLHSTN